MHDSGSVIYNNRSSAYRETLFITTLNVSHNNDGDIESVVLVNRNLSITQDMNWQKFSSESKVVFSLHVDRAG